MQTKFVRPLKFSMCYVVRQGGGGGGLRIPRKFLKIQLPDMAFVVCSTFYMFSKKKKLTVHFAINHFAAIFIVLF